jgi:hopanoid C-3 methylase
VLYRKHMSWWTAPMFAGVLARNLVRGQTNFMRGIMNYNKVYNAEKMLADHAKPVHYELPLPPRSDGQLAKASQLYIHAPRGRAGRSIDDSTERFVEETRIGASN